MILKIIIWSAVSIALITFVVETAFVYALTCKKILESGVKLPLEFRLIARFWFVLGAPADVLFNATRGWIMMREFPQELTFSARVQRICDDYAEHKFYNMSIPKKLAKQYERAYEWKLVLNAVDKNHIKLWVPDYER